MFIVVVASPNSSQPRMQSRFWIWFCHRTTIMYIKYIVFSACVWICVCVFLYQALSFCVYPLFLSLPILNLPLSLCDVELSPLWRAVNSYASSCVSEIARWPVCAQLWTTFSCTCWLRDRGVTSSLMIIGGYRFSLHIIVIVFSSSSSMKHN